MNTKDFLVKWTQIKFTGNSFIKISFFVARYVTDSLRGPVLNITARATARVWWDGMGGDGMGGQKCPSIFLILRYIKHYTYTNLYMYKKNILTNFLWVWYFGQVRGPVRKNQKHPLGMIFLNQSKSRKKVKGFPCKFFFFEVRSIYKGFFI